MAVIVTIVACALGVRSNEVSGGFEEKGSRRPSVLNHHGIAISGDRAPVGYRA